MLVYVYRRGHDDAGQYARLGSGGKEYVFSEMDRLNISIVIPTWNREKLVEELLASLSKARKAYKYGDTEVIVIDSSKGDARASIEKSCAHHDAVYLEGDNSVRKKRNKGIYSAKYEIVYFIDSDVTVCEDIINVHARTFLEDDDPKLGGSFGLTEFVGKKSFWWKILEHTTYLDSFAFAKRFPYQSWTIGNNVAFRKDVLIEIGAFKEDLPFRLGGDDLEMTYRVTKRGYKIKSAPDAVTYHSRETWNNAAAIHNRTKRWGSMEYHIRTMHPELFVNCIPKSDVMFFLFFLLAAVLCGATMSFAPAVWYGAWLILYMIGICIYDNAGKKSNIFFYMIGKSIKTHYHMYFIAESLKHKDASCFYKEMSFSVGQTMFMYKEAANKLWIFIAAFLCALIGTGFLFRFI